MLEKGEYEFDSLLSFLKKAESVTGSVPACVQHAAHSSMLNTAALVAILCFCTSTRWGMGKKTANLVLQRFCLR